MTAMGRNNGIREHYHAAGGDVRAADLTIKDYANGMPNMRLGEIFKSFMRQLKWLIPLLLLGTIASWFLTKDLKRLYEGEGRILVQLGSEYVYESVTSTTQQNSGLTLTPDHIVLNEIGLMKNSDIIERVTGELRDEFGETRFAKAEYKKINAASGNALAKKNALVDLYKLMDKSLVVVPSPKSSVVDVVFKHEDPEIAVRGINLFIAAYQEARKDIFVEGSSDVITERREATENQLRENEQAIQSFLKRNNISDFTSEQDGARERTEELRATLNLLRADMSETEAALATVEGQLRGTPERIDLFVDDRASQRVAQAELELKQLLAKYLPTSNPVRQKQEEINRLKEVQTANGGRASGGRRVGPNEVYTALTTERNTLQARADSYREKEFVLQRQLDSVDQKVRLLTEISPVYNGLLREQSTLDTRLRGYTTKEQEALINQQQAQSDSENVRVISISSLPRKGRNMRMIMFVVCTVVWGFTLFMFALLKIFLDPRLYAPMPPQGRGYNTVPYAGAGTAYGAGVGPEADTRIPEAVPMPAAAQYEEYMPQPGPVEYVPEQASAQAHTPQAYAPQAYADAGMMQQDMAYGGNAAVDYNPYMSGNLSTAKPFEAQEFGTIPASEDG